MEGTHRRVGDQVSRAYCFVPFQGKPPLFVVRPFHKSLQRVDQTRKCRVDATTTVRLGRVHDAAGKMCCSGYAIQ